MKRNISELLDDVIIDDVALTAQSPLSAKRIKEMTMARVGVKKHVSLRLLSRITVAAAVIMVMTMTACAVNNIITGEWFGGYFGSNLFEGIAQELHMIEADIGDDGEIGGDYVRTVEATAESYFNYCNIDILLCKKGTCHCCSKFKE